MKAPLFTLLCLAGCVDTNATDSETEQAATGTGGGKCPNWGCGMNSPNIEGVGFFHELNLDGLPNAEGLRIVGVELASVQYTLHVDNGTISLSGPKKVVGEALIGTNIHVQSASEAYTITIDDVGRTPMWALVRGTQPNIETYVFEWHYANSKGNLCSNPDAAGETLGMNTYHSLVFEGERIDSTYKKISTTLDSRWFNIGCAGGTLAKMQLTGHTQAAKALGFSNTIGERQAMLKMFSADYCGGGRPFTVGGQPLRWQDDALTMKFDQSPLPPATLTFESRWNQDGAMCLDTPRLAVHPSAAYPSPTLGSDIASECQARSKSLPSCSSLVKGWHVISASP